MMIDSSANVSTLSQQASYDQPVQEVDQQRQQAQNQTQMDSSEQQVQSEELLSQIKALTEDGLYSVRFEQNSDVDELVVKVVDQDTEEVIRQIPPDELLNLSKHLKELSGNIVNTVS